MNSGQFEFDVAFSFHSIDEGLATQLNDRLQDRFRTFLYSKKQEMLAGKDGEEAFTSVFQKRARLVVVFYREEWGETPFTRIEQTAIRNRAFDQGFNFTLFIPTNKPQAAPPWLPKTRLWFGLDRFGLDGAAAVIEARIQEMGGEPHVESIDARAARIQRAREFEDAKRAFRDSPLGIAGANAAFEQLTSSLKAKCESIREANSALAGLQIRKISDYWLLSGNRLCKILYWERKYSNTLDGSQLRVDLYTGVPRLPGLLPGFEEGRRLETRKFEYELVGPGRHGYVDVKERSCLFCRKL